MARQIAAVRGGQPAAEAFANQSLIHDPATAILLEAMERLYGVLSEQNQNLANINQTLETRIAERTAELWQANQTLAREQRELTDLLKKVEDAQNQLLQSEKMAAIGQLAAGVAHEINNPVGFVNSNVGTLKTYTGKLLQLIDAYEAVAAGGDPARLAEMKRQADLDFLREDLPQLIQESQDGLGRVTRIVQDLKDFSHVDESSQQEADLNAGLESTLNVVWNEIKYKAEVIRQLGEVPLVPCVPAQINQVFMNILVNAAQAIETRGTITLRSGVANGHAWFEIEDNGKGMPEEVRKRIFEPFFTTKPVGKGTGLGLSISYDIIVKKHGGSLDVSSTPRKGTCFRISLPLAPAASA
jgi:signal transduction histidine kinase